MVKLPERFPSREIPPTRNITCAEPGCETTRRSIHQWDDRQASRDGWFIQKNGDNWCPEHVPEWVEGWRTGQSTEAENLTGGFDPGDVCPECHLARSRSGACGCG